MGLLGGGAGVAGGALSALQNVLGTMLNLAMSLVRGMAAFAAALTGVALAALTTFATALVAATRSTIQYATEINKLRLNTGISMRQAAGTSLRFGAFGIGPGQVNSMFGNEPEGMFRMRAKAFGMPSYTDPNFIGRFAARNQQLEGQGIGGWYQAQAFRRSMNMDNDDGKFLGSLSQKQIQNQQGLAERTAKALGLTTDTFAKMSTELPLAIAQIKIFLQLLTIKFAQTALPLVQRALEIVIRIAERAAPVLSKLMDRFGDWLVNQLPELILTGVSSFLIGAGYFLKGLGAFTKGLIQQVPAILTVIDSILNAIQGFVNGLWAVGQVVKNLVGGGGSAAGAAAGSAVGSGSPGIGGNPALNPSMIGQVGSALWNALSGQQASNPWAPNNAVTPGRATPYNQNAFIPPGLAKALPTLGRIINAGSKAAKGAGSVAKTTGNVINTTGKVARGVGTVGLLGGAGYLAYQGSQQYGNFQQAMNSPNRPFTGQSNLAGNPQLVSRIQNLLQSASDTSNNAGDQLIKWGEGLQGIRDEIRQGNQYLKETADNTKDTAQKVGSMGMGTIARVLAYQNEDTMLGLLGN